MVTKVYEEIKITIASNNTKIPTDLYKINIALHSENHAANITIENNNKEKIEYDLFISFTNIGNFVLIKMPKNTGMVVINNRSIENFKKFNS